jgi:hypothetical protein
MRTRGKLYDWNTERCVKRGKRKRDRKKEKAGLFIYKRGTQRRTGKGLGESKKLRAWLTVERLGVRTVGQLEVRRTEGAQGSANGEESRRSNSRAAQKLRDHTIELTP